MVKPAGNGDSALLRFPQFFRAARSWALAMASK